MVKDGVALYAHIKSVLIGRERESDLGLLLNKELSLSEVIWSLAQLQTVHHFECMQCKISQFKGNFRTKRFFISISKIAGGI